jgi:hypothetical protein
MRNNQQSQPLPLLHIFALVAHQCLAARQLIDFWFLYLQEKTKRDVLYAMDSGKKAGLFNIIHIIRTGWNAEKARNTEKPEGWFYNAYYVNIA